MIRAFFYMVLLLLFPLVGLTLVAYAENNFGYIGAEAAPVILCGFVVFILAVAVATAMLGRDR